MNKKSDKEIFDEACEFFKQAPIEDVVNKALFGLYLMYLIFKHTSGNSYLIKIPDGNKVYIHIEKR